MGEPVVHFYTIEDEGEKRFRKLYCSGDVLENSSLHVFLNLDVPYKARECTVSCVLCLRKWGNRMSSLAVIQEGRVSHRRMYLRRLKPLWENLQEICQSIQETLDSEDSQDIGD